jgi:3-deoxy-D-manno-octulosonate 8-phosphate phosphatase (KDO 8-P phosphatase)
MKAGDLRRRRRADRRPALHRRAGRTFKAFHARRPRPEAAGAGGIEPVVITGRDSPAVRRRVADLGLRMRTTACTTSWPRPGAAAALGWPGREVAAMGDDWPDLPLLARAGFACAPANAHAEVQGRGPPRHGRAGGHGAAREFCDLLLMAAGPLCRAAAGHLPRWTAAEAAPGRAWRRTAPARPARGAGVAGPGARRTAAGRASPGTWRCARRAVVLPAAAADGAAGAGHLVAGEEHAAAAGPRSCRCRPKCGRRPTTR